MKRNPLSFCPSALATTFVLFLAACSASPTPFQVADGGGGYTDRQLDNGGYQVTFEGNGATPKKSVQEAVLFRAAQVTIQAETKYFKVLSNTVEPVSEPAEGSGFSLSSLLGSDDQGGLVSTLDFELLEEKPSGRDPNIYNARELISELSASVLEPSGAALQNGVIVNDLRTPRTRDF